MLLHHASMENENETSRSLALTQAAVAADAAGAGRVIGSAIAGAAGGDLADCPAGSCCLGKFTESCGAGLSNRMPISGRNAVEAVPGLGRICCDPNQPAERRRPATSRNYRPMGGADRCV